MCGRKIAKHRQMMKFCHSHLTHNIFIYRMRRFFFGLVYNTLEKPHLIKVILNNVLAKFSIVLINYGSVSSNHNIDITIINTRMF